MSASQVINDYFGQYGRIIVEEADRVGLGHGVAAALVEQESSTWGNVFGCDHGSTGDRPPYCQQSVTRARCDKLIGSDQSFPHGMNGIGLTQLTWWEFVLQAERMGGVHKPRIQCRVGFEILKSYLETSGWPNRLQAFAKYNGTGPAAQEYARKLESKRVAWQDRLEGRKPPYVAPWPPHPGATRNWNFKTQRVVNEIEEDWGVTCSTYSGHGNDGEARSIDIWIAPDNFRANSVQEAYGDRIEGWITTNEDRLDITYHIYWNHMRYRDGAWFNYEPYADRHGGSGNYNDRRHYNHHHIGIRA